MTHHIPDVDRERLVHGFRDFIADTESLLRATAEYSGESIASARTRLHDRLEQARSCVADAEAAAVDRAKHAAHAAGRVAREHPWGLAAGVLLVGVAALLLARKP